MYKAGTTDKGRKRPPEAEKADKKKALQPDAEQPAKSGGAVSEINC
jgi:hypothetical protein